MQDLTEKYVYSLLPRRAVDANKGSCGCVVAVAGSLRYRGAAALCVEAALRSGAGLVYLAAAEPVLQLALTRTPECCALPCPVDLEGRVLAQSGAAVRARFAGRDATLLAGPGLGETAGELCTALLGETPAWRGAVLDADALNAIAAQQVTVPLPANTVLTPHPGEAARLLRCTTDAVQADRLGAVKTLATAYRCTAVLKGYKTLIALPDGTLYRNTTGNAGLARGGSGDVLAGMIAALMAQGISPAAAACCGVWLHGAAADLCAKRNSQLGMLPHDILQDLGGLFLAAGR